MDLCKVLRKACWLKTISSSSSWALSSSCTLSTVTVSLLNYSDPSMKQPHQNYTAAWANCLAPAWDTLPEKSWVNSSESLQEAWCLFKWLLELQWRVLPDKLPLLACKQSIESTIGFCPLHGVSPNPFFFLVNGVQRLDWKSKPS